jgi:hypothetical protein
MNDENNNNDDNYIDKTIDEDEFIEKYKDYMFEEKNEIIQNIDPKNIPMFFINAHGYINHNYDLIIPKGIMVIYVDYGGNTGITQNNVLLNAINKDDNLIKNILNSFVNKKENISKNKNNEVKNNNNINVNYELNDVPYNCDIKCAMFNDKNDVTIKKAGHILSFNFNFNFTKYKNNISTTLSYAKNIKNIINVKNNKNPNYINMYSDIKNGKMFIPYIGQIGKYNDINNTHIDDLLSLKNEKNKGGIDLYTIIQLHDIDNVICTNNDKLCIFKKNMYDMISKYDNNITVNELYSNMTNYILKYSETLSKNLFDINMLNHHIEKYMYYDIELDNIGSLQKKVKHIKLNDVLTQINDNIIYKNEQNYEKHNINMPNGVVFVLSCSKIDSKSLLLQINSDIYNSIYICVELKKDKKEQDNEKIKQKGGSINRINYNNDVIYNFVSSENINIDIQKSIDIICKNNKKTSSDVIHQLYDFYNNMLMYFDDIINYKIEYLINNTLNITGRYLIDLLNFFKKNEFKIIDDVLYMLMNDIQYNKYNENGKEYNDIIQQTNSKINDNVGQYHYYKYYFYRMINSLRCDIYNNNQQHIIIYPHDVILILKKILPTNELFGNENNCVTYLNNKFGIFDYIYSFEYCRDIKKINMYYNNNKDNYDHYILNIIAGGYLHPKIILSFMYNYLDYGDELNINDEYDVYISDGVDEMILSRKKYDTIINTYLNCILYLYKTQSEKIIKLNNDIVNIQNIMLDIWDIINNQKNVNLFKLKEYIDKI